MPRSAFSNLKRRGAVYWWRRKIFLKALGFSEKFSISSEFSLLTKELDHARGRSAAMTAYSERLRMNLRTQVAANGLDQETAAAIFVEEMRAYRNELVHLEAAWKASPVYSKLSNSDDDLAVFQCLWQGIAIDGLGVPRDWSFVERHFPWFPEPMKVRIRGLLRDHPGLSDTVREAAIARLNAQGLEANAFNTSVAADLVVQARAAAAEAVRIVAITRAVAIIAAISLPTLAAANVIEGKAEVIDGDSLRVAGTEVRLFGVDAPEYAQTCFDNGATVPCGAMAKDALEGLIGSGVLVCVSHETDAYGRAVARCRTSGVDVGDALVSSGWATAFRRYSDEYVAAEARARASSAGIWQWDFQSPEDFRASQQVAAQQPPRARAAAPATTAPRRFEKDGMCLIKGNHSRRGDWIYHLPGMPYYDDTRAEAYFCTEAQAQAAGYRRAIVR